eukprot:scaffold97490_cov36-Phaeocystis_antarctica.AAC.1
MRGLSTPGRVSDAGAPDVPCRCNPTGLSRLQPCVPPPPAALACNPMCVSQVPQVCDVRYGARPQWHLPPAGAAGRP